MLSNSTALIASPNSSNASSRFGTKKASRKKASTLEAYERDVSRFINTYGGAIPCSPDALIAYIVLLAKKVAPVTIVRRCMAIQDAHIRTGHAAPTNDERVREALRWMAAGQLPQNLLGKTKGNKIEVQPSARSREPKRQAKPITRTLLSRMLQAMGSGTRSLERRDKVILLLGFSGLKRGTICAINIEDLEFTEDVLRISIRAESTDKADADDATSEVNAPEVRKLAIPVTRGPLCAATACLGWLEHADVTGKTGPLLPRFSRSGEPILDQRLDSAYVSVIVKRRLAAAGITDVSEYSAESLTRGHRLESLKGGAQ